MLKLVIYPIPTSNSIIMRKKQYIALAVGLIILCFFTVYIFTLPAILDRYNLTNTSNIGSTIGGITTPILGIISSIFLFLALTKQIDGNEKSRIKNEADIFFLLLNQFDLEYDKFYYKYWQGAGKDKVTTKFTGIEGIHEFVNEFCYDWTVTNFTYSNLFEAKQIALLTNSFELIDYRLEMSFLDKTLKLQFQQKLKSIYLYKFHDEVKNIPKKCAELEKKDFLINELQRFFDRYSVKYNSLSQNNTSDFISTNLD